MTGSVARLSAALADRYRIERELGAGGMATVYLAEDLRHKRKVALKVLKPELAAVLGAERFVQEITTTASLQHPHILPLLDSGSADGLLFYVMPYVAGETLRSRLERERQLPIEDALRIAREVADALGAAHALGIIHRDVKPENILLQGSHAVVADFGIALAVQEAGGARMTQTGLSLGTPAYMSPEQAMGERTVDARTDIYALGAVTYEMLTGEPPFTGATGQAILARVMTERPASIHAVRDTVPEPVEWAVLTALSKLPADRFATTAKFVDALAHPEARPRPGTPASRSAPRGRRRSGATIAVAALLLAAGWWVGRRGRAPERPWTAYTQLTDATGEETSPTLSPDGESFAYASNARGTWDIYVQRVGGRNPLLVAGDTTLDERGPAYSPDGRQILYSHGADGLFVMGATGESPRRLTTFGADPTWSPDGQRIAFAGEEATNPYSVRGGSELWVVAVAGGEPTLLTPPADSLAAYQPAWSPSGGRIAFWSTARGQRDLMTIAVTGGEPVLITDDVAVDWAPTWAPDGGTLYFASDRGGTMGVWRIGLDERSGRPRGPPELVVAGVDVAMDLPRLSRDGGAIIFRSRLETVNPATIAFDPVTNRVGAVTLLQRRSGILTPTDISPAGDWLALHNAPDRHQDIFVMRPDGRELTRLTDDPARDWSPRFAPDGKALSFYSNQGGAYGVWLLQTDGSGRTPLTDFGAVDVLYGAFSPDGRRLVAMIWGSRTTIIGTSPWPVTPASAKALSITAPGGGAFFPSNWSPDGRWIVGGIVLPSGEFHSHALHEVATGRIRRLNEDAFENELAWLPGFRRVVYFTRSGALVAQDIETLERRILSAALPFPPDQLGSIVASPDGRTLFYGARQVESNIWMVRRGAAGMTP